MFNTQLSMGVWRQQNPRYDVISGFVFENETINLLAVMSSPPTSSVQIAMNSFIGAAKASGLWTKFDCLYFMAINTNQSARLNWINPNTYELVEVNGPEFISFNGFRGDGIASYIKVSTDISINSFILFQNNNHSAFVFCNTFGGENAGSTIKAIFAITQANQLAFNLMNRALTNSFMVYKDFITSATTINVSTDTILLTATRSFTTTNLYQYNDILHTAISSSSIINVSGADKTLSLLARNNDGTIHDFFSKATIGAFGLGQCLSASDVNTLNFFLRNYLGSVGAI